MKKFRFLLILLCFCMLLPIAACGKDEPQNEVPDDKYYYDEEADKYTFYFEGDEDIHKDAKRAGNAT